MTVLHQILESVQFHRFRTFFHWKLLVGVPWNHVLSFLVIKRMTSINKHIHVVLNRDQTHVLNQIHLKMWMTNIIQITLSWQSFSCFIYFLSAAKLNLVDSPNLQTNFSLDTDPADTYTLEVSAVIGPNKSDEAPPKGIQFSYNKNSPASKKCE